MENVGRAAGEPQFGAIGPEMSSKAQNIIEGALGNVAQPPRLKEGSLSSGIEPETIKEGWVVLSPRLSKSLSNQAVAKGLRNISEKFEREFEASEAEPPSKKPKFR